MRYLRGLPSVGWVIVGLVAGLILAPAAAVAATVMVLHGANGASVNATSDNQLLTAEAPPSSWVSEYGWNGEAGTCSNLPAASATRGFIVRQINIDVLGLASSDSIVYVSRGPGCSGKVIAEVDANGTDVVYPFTPGVALPAKGQLSFLYNGPVSQVRVQMLGYTVPAADAPAYTPVLVCSTAASACGP